MRIDAGRLRRRVVGEGGNLGFTQLGRVEFALGGGRINTHAIDNSAGVDCSDHEVNIKILLDRVAADGDLTGKQRDALLVETTDEVAELVLSDRRRPEAGAVRRAAQAHAMLDVHVRYRRARGVGAAQPNAGPSRTSDERCPETPVDGVSGQRRSVRR